MIINKETILETIKELGNVSVTEFETKTILVRSAYFETTLIIKLVFTGTTITRVKTACFSDGYFEVEHDEREYKTLNGLIDYIMKHMPLQEQELYSCKNDRVVKNRFKELIQYDINNNAKDFFNHNNDILVSTETSDYSIRIKVTNGQFKATVMMFRRGQAKDVYRVNSFVDLQSLLFKKGVI